MGRLNLEKGNSQPQSSGGRLGNVPIQNNQPPQQNIQVPKKGFAALLEFFKKGNREKASDSLARVFPQTFETLAELQTNPLSLNKKQKAKKKIKEAIKESFANPVVNEKKNINDLLASFKNKTPLSQKIGTGISSAVGLANIAFSPVSAAFETANRIPGIGSVSRLATLPFSAVGEGVAKGAQKGVSVLPVSEQTKQNISQPTAELAALLAQLAVGKLGGKILKGNKPVLEKALISDKANVSELKSLELPKLSTNERPTQTNLVPKEVKGFKKATVEQVKASENIFSEARSVGGRLERLSPETKKIKGMLDEVDTKSSIDIGKKTLELKNLDLPRLQKKNPGELFNVTDALEGKKSIGSLTPQGRKLYDFFSQLRQETAQKAKETSLKIKTRYGNDLDFVERKRYIPHQIPDNAQLIKGTVRKDVMTNLIRRGFAKDPKDASLQIDKFVEFRETGGSANRDYFAKKLVDSGQAKTLSEAKGKITRFFKASRQQRSSNLEKAREIDLPFYDPNPLRYIPKYLESTQQRLASAEILGANFEKADSLLGQIKNPDSQKIARELIKVARGANEPGSITANKALQTGRKLSTFKLNPLSTITNLGQSANSLLASSTGSFIKGSLKSLTKSGRNNAIESGALSESVLRGVQNAAASEGKLVGRYIKGIGFSGAEKVLRTVAANTGIEWAKKMSKRIMKNPGDKFATKELRLLEIDPIKILNQGGKLVKDDMLRAAKTFTGKTQFLSRPTDLPRFFTSSELGKSMMQFKSFSYQQARFLAEKTVGELKTGNPGRFARNLAVLATVYPMTGEVIADVRALIQGKERTTKGLARYLEDAAQVGAFGILYDAINAASFGGGVANFIVGPTLSTAGKDLELFMKGIKPDTKLNASDKRYLINQIPLGSTISNRLSPNKDKNL